MFLMHYIFLFLVVGVNSLHELLCDVSTLLPIAVHDDVHGWDCEKSSDPCSPAWSGVTCENSEIVAINLSFRQIAGRIPSILLEMPSLRYLNLSNNLLIGPLPEISRRNIQLTTLDVSNNRISGAIPTSWSHLQGLTSLMLHNNHILALPQLHMHLTDDTSMHACLRRLTVTPTQAAMCDIAANADASHVLSNLNWDCDANGPITAICSTWVGVTCTGADVTAITLSASGLTGSIPEDISKVTTLLSLDLSDNTLSLTIPAGFSSLVALTSLVLHTNYFSTSIPTEICSLTNLVVLNLRSTSLIDALPSCLGSLNKLSKLELQYNSLSGSIPLTFTALTALTSLRIFSNERMTGQFPSGLCAMTKLTTFYYSSASVHECSLTASPTRLPTRAPTQIPTAAPPGSHIALCDLIASTNIAARKAALGWPGWSCSGSGTSLAATGLCSGTPWTGVGCNGTSVTSIAIDNKGISGSLPLSLGSLTALTTLDINQNSFTGFIPSTIGSLHATLKVLKIAHNQLQGSLSSGIGYMTNLQALQMNNNQFIGQLPSSLGALSKLTELYLAYNSFGGVLPSTFSNLIGMKDMRVYHCSLDGALPNWSNMNKLTHFLAYSNRFTGTIPSMSSLTNLVQMQLEANKLQGHIPSSIGAATAMQFFYANYNNLVGGIPSVIGDATNLVSLKLFNNYNLGGVVPFTITKLNKLATLHVYNCGITNIGNVCSLPLLTSLLATQTGQHECTLPTSAPTLAPVATPSPAAHLALCDLIDSTNIASRRDAEGWGGWSCVGTGSTRVATGLCGAVTWFGVSCSSGKVSTLQLNGQSISGTLSSTLGDLSDLTVLDLHQNSISGVLPASISKMVELQQMYLFSNSLSGPIPSNVGFLTKLYHLRLQDNILSGTIPTHLGSLTNLQSLLLYSNRLKGILPTSLSTLTSLAYFQVNDNSLTGVIPASFSSWINILYFQVHSTRISGSIPTSFTALTKLQRLYTYSTDMLSHYPAALCSISSLTQFYFTAENVHQCTEPTLSPISPPTHAPTSLPTSLQPATYSVLCDLLNSTNIASRRAALGWTGWTCSDSGASRIAVGLCSSTSWTGVICTSNAITVISLTSAGITGTLPSSIGMLTNLVSFSLHSNSLGGTIPSTIGSLTKLEILWLYGNSFTGTIPESVGSLTTLTHFNVYSNLVTNIPSSIGSLVRLTYLYFTNCPSMVGTIPSNISLLSNLQDLRIENTRVGGSIPSTLSSLHKLSILRLLSNSLSGAVPTSFTSMTKLQTLLLYDNVLNGQYPAGLCGMSTLTNFKLTSSSVSQCLSPTSVPSHFPTSFPSSAPINVPTTTPTSCPTYVPSVIPTSVPTASYIASGPVIAICDLLAATNIADVGVGWSCTDSGETVVAEGLCTEHWFGVDCNGMDIVSIDISDAGVVGVLPSSIGLLTSLRSLTARNNSLRGVIPPTIGSLTLLEILSLQHNSFTGPIPSTLSTIPLQQLLLGFNKLSSSIPASIGGFSVLKTLDLRSNKLSGSIPSSVGDMTSLLVAQLNANALSSSLPSQLGNLVYLEILKLSHNKLVGSVPASFTQLTNLIILRLDNNKLNGQYPVELCSAGKEIFTLSNYPMHECTITSYPTATPSAIPTVFPTDTPTAVPTVATVLPTSAPSLYPTANPSAAPASNIHIALCELIGSTSIPTRRDQLDWVGWSCKGNVAINLCSIPSWYGITCSGGKVISLNLYTAALTGSIPTSIGYLTDLTSLNLGVNGFGGAIPSTIGSLTKMTNLILNTNKFIGSLPSSIGSLVDLTSLQLFSTSVSGAVPSSFSKLTKLVTLKLYYNKLNGAFPSELCSSMQLTTFLLSSPAFHECRLPTTLPTASPVSITASPTWTSPTVFIPSQAPSRKPTLSPTASNTYVPTAQISQQPSKSLTSIPSGTPTSAPSKSPTEFPSFVPSAAPSISPTAPTIVPTYLPTVRPTYAPTYIPSVTPTSKPTHRPTLQPSISLAPNHTPTTKTPTLKPTSFPTPIPEIPPEILLLTTSATRSSIFVDVVLSSDGSVHCAAVTSGYVPTSTTEVINNNIFSISKSSTASVVIPNLTPVTTYDIFCAVKSPGGYIATYTSMIDKKASQTTSCCKVVTIGLSSIVIKENSIMTDFISISLDFAPSTAFDIKLTVSDSVLSSLYPSTVSFTRSYGKQQSVMMTGLPGGNYSLRAECVGDAADEYQIVYPRGKNFTVLSKAVEPPLPIPIATQFTNDGLSINVMFDAETDRAKMTATAKCSDLFSFAAAAECICLWSDASVVTIKLSNKVQLTPGQTIKLRSGKIRASCDMQLSTCQSWKTLPETTLQVLAPANPFKPTVRISSPTMVSRCDEPVVDLASSSGSSGRSWISVNISVSSEHRSSAASLQNFFATSYKLNPPTPIPKNMLHAPYYYDIVVTLCNFLNGCGSANHRWTVTDTAAPTVSIVGSTFRTMMSQNILSLSSIAFVTMCDGETDTATLQYKWQITENGVVVSGIINQAKEPTKYRLPAYTLRPLQQYTVDLAVFNPSSQRTTSAHVVIDVKQGILVAGISGGQSQSVRRGESIQLRSTSYDEDGAMSAALPAQISYSWSCYQTEPVFNSSCLLCFQYDDVQGKRVTVSPRVDASVDSVHIVWLIVRDNTRQSDASMSLRITSPASPIVAITSAMNTKFNAQSQLRLAGIVRTSYPTSARWSSNDPNLDLSVALTPTSMSISAGSNIVSFVLPASALNAATPRYIFVLECDSVVSQISITINTPPSNGQFTVTPTNGTELLTIFSFVAFEWVDEDLPLEYDFAYSLSSVSMRMIIQAKSEMSYGSSQLPAAYNSDMLSVSVKVQDTYGAPAVVSTLVAVTPGQLSDVELQQKAAEQMASMSESADAAKRAISLVSSIMNTRDCSAAPNCTLMHRHPCTTVSNTCGKCKAGYIGDDASNTMCDVQSNESPTICNSDDACSSVNECVNNVCVRRNKVCAGNCSGHGACEMKMLDTNDIVTSCRIGDSTCAAMCSCHRGYTGFSCGVYEDEMEKKQAIREELLDGLSALTTKDDLTLDNVVGWVTGLSSVTQSADELSTAAATKAVDIASDIVTTAAALNISYDKLFGLLDAVSAATLASFTTSTRRRLSNSAVSTIQVLDQYGVLAAEDMLAGQNNENAIYDLFIVSSQVHDNDINVSLTLPQVNDAPSPTCQLTATANSDTITAVVIASSARVYETSQQFTGKPLRVKLLKEAGIAEAYITLQNTLPQDYIHLTTNITQNTTCLAGVSSEHVYYCPTLEGNTTITHTCNGTAALISTRCADVAVMPKCYVLSGEIHFICDVSEFTSTNVTCHCWSKPNRRLSFGLDDTGLLEVGAISVHVGNEFATTITTADDFDSFEDVKRVLVVIIMYGSLWACGLLAIAVFTYKSRVKSKQRTKFFTMPKEPSHESIRERLMNYIDSVLPEVFNGDSGFTRLYREIKRHHRYIQLFTATGIESESTRIITGVHLLTVQTMLMFILAVIYDTEFPDDDGSCGQLTSEKACLRGRSIFDQSETECLWQVDENGFGECRYADRQLTWNMVAIISVVVALFTSPANSFVDFIFIDILSAPTADTHKVAAVSRLGAVQRRVSNAARRVSAVGEVALNKLRAARPTMFHTTRVVPDYAVEAYSQARASTRHVLTSAQQHCDQYESRRKTQRVTRAVATPKSSVEALMQELIDDIAAQRNGIKNAELLLFDMRWGLDGAGNFIDHDLKSSVCSRRRSVVTSIRQQLEEVQKLAEEKRDKLTLATDVQIGMEILHLFILDLLGRDSVAGRVFCVKSEEDFKHKLVVARWQKRLLWLFVVCMNLFFVYFSLLRGLQRGAAWQIQYASACALQFIVEMILFETSECVIMHFMIPSAVTNEVRAAFVSVKQIVQQVCVGAFSNFNGALDAPRYLFVSNMLAVQFPHLMESVIVRSYHTYLPSVEVCRPWSRSRVASTWTWRRIARSLTISALAMGLLRYFAVLPAELQRLIVHMLQPVVFSSFLIAWMFLENNPYFAVIPIALVVALVYSLWKDIRKSTPKLASIAPLQQTTPNNAIPQVYPDESKDSDQDNDYPIPLHESSAQNEYQSFSDSDSTLDDPDMLSRLRSYTSDSLGLAEISSTDSDRKSDRVRYPCKVGTSNSG